MRLPEFLTALHPIGETLAAAETGETALRDAAAAENARLAVSTADGEGLSLWETDLGLPDGSGEDPTARRARILAALAGGQTLTVERLRALCVAVGGFDRGEVTEDYPNWAVTVDGVAEGRVPPDGEALASAVARLGPAHLRMTVRAVGETAPALPRYAVCYGAVQAEIGAAAE